MDSDLLSAEELPALPSGFQPSRGTLPNQSALQQPSSSNVLIVPQRVQQQSLLQSQGQPGFGPREDLINSIVAQESGGNPKARGKAGERGLMQIQPATAAQYGITPDQLDDPTINRRIGSQYFGDLLKRYKGNEFLALVAYNSGPHRVDKGVFLPQSIKYATSILSRAKSGAGNGNLPVVEAQVGAGQQGQAPSILDRMGGALGSALEGTAYAEELPPLPSGFKPRSSPMTGEPSASAALPALPSGATPTMPASPAAGLGQMKPSITFGPSGMRMGLTGVNPPSSIQTQQYSADVVLGQVNDAIKFYDGKIGPRWEKDFSGSLLTPSGRRGFMQPTEAQSSRWTQAFGLGERSGGRGDPDVAAFYDKVGPIMAEQMKALIGGRIGQGLINGPIAPHLPNMDKDTLPRIREKLEDLKENIPIILQKIQQMRQRGMTDDQILQSFGVDPSTVPAEGSALTGDGGSAPPPGFVE